MSAAMAIVLAVHFLRYAGPLIYVPMVVRLLSVTEAGMFFRYQSLSLLLALFVEFGLSGTALRDWARQEGGADKARLFNLLMSERIGNGLCVVGCCAAAFAAGALTGTDLLVILPLALISGMNMTWYFMASGRPVVGSALEAAGQAVSVALLVGTMWITGSAAWAAAALISGQLLNLVVGLIAVRRDGLHVRPAISLDIRYKIQQFPMFVVRIGSMISSAGSPWVVATAGGVVQAALYGPSARLFGALAATMSPIGDVIIPRISRQSRVVRRHQAFVVATGALLVGAIIAAAIHVTAEPIAVFLYGQLGGSATEVVRLLALSVPFMFASQALSLFVFIPGGRERVAALAIVLGAFAFVGLTLANPNAEGAALAKVAAEAVSFAIMFGVSLASRERSSRDA